MSGPVELALEIQVRPSEVLSLTCEHVGNAWSRIRAESEIQGVRIPGRHRRKGLTQETFELSEGSGQLRRTRQA